ncbi:MAG TPA: prenyltransferase/squalene oxidase repeat-containing protein [Flexivirga sp.]|uniref:prenyltransferase/squalene oxidase repeat-containing protein n=1 Tax=Flexivirga sp. TaxID=1962927 RepID=UPI002B6D9718|nr:prenyltransferase/squalene oxidase repeat-containing protein [Flexivirga sp.]HWC20702.1 prenyltransferase/squalene oxidase repeat-containing protein [Flexivirga sp.]
MTTSPHARAGLAGIAALACAGLTGIAVAAPAHAAAPDATSGAHFLASELAAGGDHFSVSSGGASYADYGLTIDGILGLDAARTGQAEAQRAASYITKNAAAYNSYGKDVYAGATAKLLVFAQAQGLPTAGYLKDLKSLEQPSGQFKDKSASGDYSNTIGQSLAIVGLTRAGQPDTAAVNFLLEQQCSNGGFRMTFTEKCTGDTDATSLAVQALSAAGGHRAQLTKAVNFIAGKQRANGGVVEPAAQAAPNTNSTGLAAVAFALAGRSAEAAKAKSFVTGLQFGCSAPAALRGGFAFDRKSFDAQLTKGAKATAGDKEHRASAQAMLALTQQPYLKISAGGSATASAPSCAPGGPTSSATSTASATSTTTGPAIITDGSASGGGNTGVLLAGAAVLGGVALAGSGLRRRLRSQR